MAGRANSRRDELLDALVKELVDEGIASISLRPLARRLGVSTYSLTYHFGNKAAIVHAAVEHLIARQQVRLQERLESLSGAGPKAAIEAAWMFVCDSLAEDRLLLEIALARDPAIPPEARRAVTGTWVQLITGMLRERGMQPDEASREATLVQAVLLGLELDLMTSGERARLDAVVRQFAEKTALRWLRDKGRPSS